MTQKLTCESGDCRFGSYQSHHQNQNRKSAGHASERQGTKNGLRSSPAPPERGRSGRTVQLKELGPTLTSAQPSWRGIWREQSADVARNRRIPAPERDPDSTAPIGKGRVLPKGRRRIPPPEPAAAPIQVPPNTPREGREEDPGTADIQIEEEEQPPGEPV